LETGWAVLRVAAGSTGKQWRHRFRRAAGLNSLRGRSRSRVLTLEAVDVVVAGGGQAGLATSHQLTEAGIEHVVLERSRVGQAWRDRWDSFTLVIPNWTLDLPGFPYRGPDPDEFMPRDEIVSYLESYAASFDAPVREGVEVTGLEQTGAGWTVKTSASDLATRAVVVATGAFPT
jgi:putative flavoprotein involved in K+ transport